MVMRGAFEYKLVSPFKFADKPSAHVSLYFKSLLTETVRRYSRVDLVAGDCGFLSRFNCDLMAGVGVVLRFYPKKNSRVFEGW